MDAGVADPKQAGQMYHDETAWCAAFVGHVTRLMGLRLPQLPARARSWLTVGMPIPLEDARIGWDIVVLERGDGPQPGPEVIDAPGHVGWFAGYVLEPESPFAPKAVRVLGGNQGDQVSTAIFHLRRVLGVRRLLQEHES